MQHINITISHTRIEVSIKPKVFKSTMKGVDTKAMIGRISPIQNANLLFIINKTPNAQ